MCLLGLIKKVVPGCNSISLSKIKFSLKLIVPFKVSIFFILLFKKRMLFEIFLFTELLICFSSMEKIFLLKKF